MSEEEMSEEEKMSDCPDGGTGRRASFRDQFSSESAGSIPVLGTVGMGTNSPFQVAKMFMKFL